MAVLHLILDKNMVEYYSAVKTIMKFVAKRAALEIITE